MGVLHSLFQGAVGHKEMLPQELRQVLEGNLAMLLQTQELIRSKGSIADVTEKCSYLVHRLTLTQLFICIRHRTIHLSGEMCCSQWPETCVSNNKQENSTQAFTQTDLIWEFLQLRLSCWMSQSHVKLTDLSLSGTGFSCRVCSLFYNCM